MKKKTLSVVAFLGAFIIAGGLVANCSKQPKQQPAPLAKKEQPAVPVSLPAPPARINVDFNQAILADVVPFVTEHTGKGFVLNGTEGKTISWTEYGIEKRSLLRSFLACLDEHGLEVQIKAGTNIFVLSAMPEPPSPVRLDYAKGEKGLYFFLDGQLYREADFPYPTHQDHLGQWYAMVSPSALSSGSSKKAQD